MKKIPEKLLHIIWKHQLFVHDDLRTVTGEHVTVKHPGEHHADAGPDFFNARINIDETEWAGNIEIHVNASDWIRHGHQNDRAYDSVILHVVRYYDCEITDSSNRSIPALVIPCSDRLLNRFHELMQSEQWLPCEKNIHSVTPISLRRWITALTIERLEKKYLKLKIILDRTKNDWEQLLFESLSSCFGIPLNRVPFEMLAGSTDIRSLIRIKDDPFKLEAVLFGRAGFLTGNLPFDYYFESLLKEYLALRKNENEVPFHLWKFLRLRPGSFPSIRIALLASLIHSAFPLTEKILESGSVGDLYRLFRVRAGDYWNTHYMPGKLSPARIKYTGQKFTDTLIINAIVPFLFILGKHRDQPARVEMAITLLEEIAPEKNGIMENWGKFGVIAKNAFDSQALIELYNSYCKQKRCLDCQIGITLIAPP